MRESDRNSTSKNTPYFLPKVGEGSPLTYEDFNKLGESIAQLNIRNGIGVNLKTGGTGKTIVLQKGTEDEQSFAIEVSGDQVLLYLSKSYVYAGQGDVRRVGKIDFDYDSANTLPTWDFDLPEGTTATTTVPYYVSFGFQGGDKYLWIKLDEKMARPLLQYTGVEDYELQASKNYAWPIAYIDSSRNVLQFNKNPMWLDPLGLRFKPRHQFQVVLGEAGAGSLTAPFTIEDGVVYTYPYDFVDSLENEKEDGGGGGGTPDPSTPNAGPNGGPDNKQGVGDGSKGQLPDGNNSPTGATSTPDGKVPTGDGTKPATSNNGNPYGGNPSRPNPPVNSGDGAVIQWTGGRAGVGTIVRPKPDDSWKGSNLPQYLGTSNNFSQLNPNTGRGTSTITYPDGKFGAPVIVWTGDGGSTSNGSGGTAGGSKIGADGLPVVGGGPNLSSGSTGSSGSGGSGGGAGSGGNTSTGSGYKSSLVPFQSGGMSIMRGESLGGGRHVADGKVFQAQEGCWIYLKFTRAALTAENKYLPTGENAGDGSVQWKCTLEKSEGTDGVPTSVPAGFYNIKYSRTETVHECPLQPFDAGHCDPTYYQPDEVVKLNVFGGNVEGTAFVNLVVGRRNKKVTIGAWGEISYPVAYIGYNGHTWYVNQNLQGPFFFYPPLDTSFTYMQYTFESGHNNSIEFKRDFNGLPVTITPSNEGVTPAGTMMDIIDNSTDGDNGTASGD